MLEMRLKMSGREFAVAGLLVGLAVLVFMPMACTLFGPPEDHKLACQMNMKQIAQAFDMYCSENGGRYPSIPDRIGPDCQTQNTTVMMFAGRPMFPDYLNDAHLLICPDDIVDLEDMEEEWQMDATGLPNPCLVDDTSYLYFGWIVPAPDETGMEKYVQAVQTALQQPPPRGFDSPLPLERELLRRLAKPVGVVDSLVAPPEAVPVLIDNFVFDQGILLFNHIPGGSNVMFLDGHVEFVLYPHFPLLKSFGTFVGEKD